MERIVFAILLVSLISSSLTAQSFTASKAGSISQAVQPFVDSGDLVGAVMLVASKDKLLSVETVGMRDREAKQPMPADTIFRIASETKSITATALMMLVDEGKVNVDDPVEKYLPEFRCIMVKRADGTVSPPEHKLLVRHVLTHTSGINPRGVLYDQLKMFDFGVPIEARVKVYATNPLDFEPGTKFAYGRVGPTTVARIIEVASGMPYEEFLQKRLFDPLGMKDTGFVMDEGRLDRYSISYQREKKPDKFFVGRPSIPKGPTFGKQYPAPAGGLMSTAADIGRLCQMLLSGGLFEGKRYLKEATVNMMLMNQTGSLKEKYSFGWIEEEVPLQRVAAGGDTGVRMVIDRKNGLALVWMTGQPDRPDAAVKAFEAAAIAKFGSKL